MGSDASSDISLETDMSLSSHASEKDSVSRSGASVKNEIVCQKLCSLLALFQTTKCLEKCSDRWTFSDYPASTGWQALLSAAASIDRIELDRCAKQEASQISPVVYIRLASQLKGTPLFPLLDSLHIEDFDAFVEYLPLLISPVLQTVELVGSVTVTSSTTPTIIALKSYLGDLHHLSPSLKTLRPLPLIADFILSVGSQSLGHLIIDIFPDSARPPPKQKIQMKCAKKQSRSDSSGPDGIVKGSENGFESLIGTIVSRWNNSLKDLTILASKAFRLEFSQLTCLRGLEYLDITGCLVSGFRENLKPSASVWQHLQKLHLPQTYTVSFPLLLQLAIAAPLLEQLALSLDVEEALPVDRPKALIHPLRSLRVQNRDSSREWFESPRDNVQYRLIKVARYLNALFPNLRVVIANEKQHKWGEVLRGYARDRLARARYGWGINA
ncbi:hypothetical protein AN958_03585 [Leucoagaricus sp. SymC.cos]|nr:hypothetical protein AN958_03585 [Leucoagaricus sp. SymC.cos]